MEIIKVIKVLKVKIEDRIFIINYEFYKLTLRPRSIPPFSVLSQGVIAFLNSNLTEGPVGQLVRLILTCISQCHWI